MLNRCCSWICVCFGKTYINIGTIQRRLAWPLRNDDTQIREVFQSFFFFWGGGAGRVQIVSISFYCEIKVIIVIIIIIPDNNKDSRDQEILGWYPARDSLISCGEGSSLAVVGNPSRDGVSIKILVWSHLKTNPQLLRVNHV